MTQSDIGPKIVSTTQDIKIFMINVHKCTIVYFIKSFPGQPFVQKTCGTKQHFAFFSIGLVIGYAQVLFYSASLWRHGKNISEFVV